METGILTTIWGRPELTRYHLEHLGQTGMEIYAAVSEDWAMDLAYRYTKHVLRVENRPFGRKKNALLAMALDGACDRFMETGSDDFFNLARLDEYLTIPSQHYAPNCCYFVDLPNGEAKFTQLRSVKVWGAGRVFTRKAAEDAFPLWDHSANEIMDGQANRRLGEAGYPVSPVQAPIFVDVKTEKNIHPYSRFGGKPVSLDKLASLFPVLKELKKNGKLT